MKKRMFIPMAVCAFLLAANCAAAAASIFGPNQYIRTTGPKNVYTATYSASPGPGLITILNGEENGDNRVTSATVTFNGANIFVPNDFKKAVYRLEKQVTLAATNTIVINLASKPGSYLTFTQSQDAPSLIAAADPATILAGQTATLTWGSTLADSISIDQGIGNVELSGTLNVSPQATTVYTFTSSGAGGTSTFPVTVTVIPLPTANITATPETIVIGNSCELAWTSENADRVEIDNGIGPVPHSGSLSVFPTDTTTYTMNATGPGGSAFSDASVTVITLPTITMSADPQEIEIGGSFVLTWSVSYADAVIGEQSRSTGTVSEEIPLAGSAAISPSRTTTYKIIATGPGGAVSNSLTVAVNVPPPILSLSASPHLVSSGTPSILSWSATHADDCSITPDIGKVAANDSIEISPAQTTTYRLTAIGPGGTATADATVSVGALTPAVVFSSTPGEINSGESSRLSWQVFLADSCEITPEIGAVDLNGTALVSPSQTTTFTLTAIGPGGTTSKNITVTMPDVDLEAVHMDSSKCTTDGQTLEITGTADVVIKNNGTGIAEKTFLITLFEDRDHNCQFDPAADNILGGQTVSAGVTPGTSVTETIPISGAVDFADNRIYSYVDSGDAIRECDESNNIIHSMSHCQHHPPVGDINPIVEWRWSGSAVNPQYNKVTSIPVVAQLTDDNDDGWINHDDVPDIVFNSYYRFEGGFHEDVGIIRVVSGDGGGEHFSITNNYSLAVTNPAVGDIDNDGLVEILFATTGRRVAAYENDGTFKWVSDQTYELPSSSIKVSRNASIVISDIDEDGIPEIIAGSHVYDNNGDTRWIGSIHYGYGFYNTCVANLDLEGHPELLAGKTAYRLNANGQLEVYWTDSCLGGDLAAVGNLDQDPYPEIVLSGGISLSLVDHTGQKIRGIGNSNFGTFIGPATIADFDNDGQPEIGAAGSSYYVVLEADLSVKWRSPIHNPNDAGSSVFDFNGDGVPEVVYADTDYFRIYRGTDGNILFQKSIGNMTNLEYPVVADVDNDNCAEIICVSSNSQNHGIMVLGDANGTWRNTRKIWNQHAYSITNVNDDGTIPQAVANNWETFNNFRVNEMRAASGCKDLSASMIRINRTAMPDTAGLIVRIGNAGALYLNPGVNASFYNGDPAGGGILLGAVQTTERLNAGQYADLTFNWNNPVVDLYTIYVKADDNGSGEGNISESNEENNTAVSQINLGNQSPVANAGSDQTVLINDIVTLNGANSSDPEGKPLSYAWSLASKPVGSMAVLSAADTEHPLFTADMEGQYVIQLTVNDGALDSGIDMVVIIASPPITVPDLTGKTQSQAISAIAGLGLVQGAVSRANSDKIAADRVCSQFPAPGAVVPLNTGVDLTLSLGIHMVDVPDLTGMTLAEAAAAVSAANLTLGNTSNEYINIQPAGAVFDQTPDAGAQIVHDSAVDLKISLGIWTGEDSQPPYVWISANPGQVNIGNPVFITVTAADNVAVAATQLTINGQSIPLTNGQAAYIPQTGGYFTVKATAFDGAGLDSSSSTLFKAVNPYDTILPYVSLDEKDCPDVYDLYTVTGRVYDAGGVSYTLSYRRQGDLNWIDFSEGSGINISGELGLFDPTILRNGVYEIRLSAVDLAGNTAQVLGCALVDGQMKLGRLILPDQDAHIPAPGFPVTLEREFDSRNPDGDFGPGWSLPSSSVKPMTTRNLGGGWAQESKGTFITTYYLIEKYRHVVVIRFSDEEVIKFKLDITPKSSVLYPISSYNLRARYVPIDRTTGTLEALNASNDHLMLVGNDILEWGSDPYEPTRFKYTRPDGVSYVLNTHSGIESMTDAYGHTITYSDSGISHSSGACISIERGTSSRIEKITDPLGRIVEYHYDQDGMLVKVLQTGPEPEIFRTMARYGYTSGVFGRPRIQNIIAPDGTILGRFEYDGQDRVTGLIDAQGNRMVYGFDAPNHVQEITDRRGNTTLYEYNHKGYVTQKTDPEGNVTTYTYDDGGNKLSETDPLGNTRYFSYDASGNMLTETDPLGNTTTYTYNERNDILTRTDPLGHPTTYTYDSLGNVISETDPLGNTKQFTYDAHGNVLSETDASGNVAMFAYDAAGNRVQEIAANGKVTTWTYDGYGNEITETITRTTPGGVVAMTFNNEYDRRHRLIRTVDSMRYEALYEYNNRGKKIAETGKNGERTEFEYNANGNETAIHFADGTRSLTDYDEEGNRIAATDRDGNTTYFEYDANNQLIRVIHPDSSESEMVFDQAGRLVATIDENGNETQFEYDAAGRCVKVEDAIGNEISFNYDAAGNQISTTDPKGASTHYVYDSLNRQIKTIHPDDTFSQVGYDSLGRKTSETDPSGRSTLFGYDAAGNLITVTDALNQVTEYTYDEVGNRLTHTDPNGHSESWTYDDLGRVKTHTLPLGMTETFAYDGNGNILNHRDFNGAVTHYQYSPCCGRLTQKTYPDGNTVSFTYSGTGRRETVTDARGATQYEYDNRGRLEQVTNPDGSILSYTYDSKGNRTSVTTPSGATTYTYDQLNRMAGVIDPSGGITTYAYDVNGSQESITYPNGTMAGFTYDAQNRLVYLENRTSGGNIITSYFYTLDPSGNRTRVTENTGRVVNYRYDDVHRLVEENIIDPANGNETTAYTYDPAGNRLTKTGSAGSITYTYDANDRLITESGPAGSFTYSYDANGNTTGKSGNGENIDYAYDNENRLIGVDTPLSEIGYVYDADGTRVSQTVDGAQTSFLVDKNRDYAQVLEERDHLGSLTVSYIYGDDLIAQDRGGIESYYHYDGLGSTRALTDDSATLTDSYTYEAFGNLTTTAGNTENKYRFTGEQYDPNAGFYYLRARYYDPGVGRFVTRDTFKGKPCRPMTLHKYMYADMNPVMHVDPKGQFSLSENAVATAIYTIVGRLALSYYTGLAREMVTSYWRVRVEGEDAGFCGSGSTDAIVPDDPFGYHFSPPCEAHDICYRGNGLRKDQCDWNFYEDMLDVCRGLNAGPITYFHCNLTARHYFIAVWALGDDAYQGP